MKKFTVNKRNHAIEEVAKRLNECKMLLALNIEKTGNKFVLYLETELGELEYAEFNAESMKLSLLRLREMAPDQDDIDELLEELAYVKHQ